MSNTEKSDYASLVPKYHFSDILDQQEEELRANPLLTRMIDSRKKFAGDPYRPIYHYVNPEGMLNDPNGLCFWQGNWHLFYQGYPPEDPRQHWGHAISKDLIHWRDLPYAIYPDPEEKCFSGATLVENDRVIAMYYGTKVGEMVAISSDPLLLNWEKVTGKQVIDIRSADGSELPYVTHDPCIWKTGETYYALSNGKPRPVLDYLFKSTDLEHWEYLHPFIENDRFTLVGDDGACPYFWPIGDRHILIFFSHKSGGQYLLGDFDTGREKFVVTSHGRFNFGASTPSGVHAPSATPDGDGGIIVLFNMNPGKPTEGWDQIMSLPRRLRLVGSEELSIEPAVELDSLRYAHVHEGPMRLPANQEIVLNDQIGGNSFELSAQFDPKDSTVFELNLLRSPDGEEVTRFSFFKERGFRIRQPKPAARKMSLVSLDTSHSSNLPDVRFRAPETAPLLFADGDKLDLKVYVDRSIVEVFVNGRQCVAARIYPGREDSIGVSVAARGQDATIESLDAWKLNSIYR